MSYNSSDTIILVPSLTRSSFEQIRRIKGKSRYNYNTNEIHRKFSSKHTKREIDNNIILGLISSLSKSLNPEDIFDDNDKNNMMLGIKMNLIKSIHKKYDQQWQLKRKYNGREYKKELKKKLISIDTFSLFLSTLYDTVSSYVVISDVWSEFTIDIMSNDSCKHYEGKYPNILKQPFYYHTNDDLLPKSNYNLLINCSLQNVLPKNYLGLDSIGLDNILYEYVLWYLRRSNYPFFL